MPSLIDNSAIGEDTYTSSLPWSTVSRSFYSPSLEVSQPMLSALRQKFQGRILGDPAYQSYLKDVATLNAIRKKKAVSLKESVFRVETEKIKLIENYGFLKLRETRNYPKAREETLCLMKLLASLPIWLASSRWGGCICQ